MMGSRAPFQRFLEKEVVRDEKRPVVVGIMGLDSMEATDSRPMVIAKITFRDNGRYAGLGGIVAVAG
jgi:hypothetical protein